jgi:prepilin-type N-terminal cleavage/methylation domain-containing protein
MNHSNRKLALLQSHGEAGMTLVEVMVGLGLLGVMMVSFYGGFAFAFSGIRLTRENVRATQILEERMEVVRLLNWDQVINLPNYIPRNFTAPFYSENVTNPPPDNFNFAGTVVITNAPVAETYASDLRLITIQVTWPSGKITRKRQMTTMVGQYGLQKYVY